MFVERKTPELCSNLQNAAHWSGDVLLFQQRKSRGYVHSRQIPRACYQNEKSGCNAGQGWLQIARMVSSSDLLLNLWEDIPKFSSQSRFDPTPESGNTMGLDLILDAHTDQVTSSVTKPFQVNLNYVAYISIPGAKFLIDTSIIIWLQNKWFFLLQGFEALIDSRMEYPLMSRNKILIRPGCAVGQFKHICEINCYIFK